MSESESIRVQFERLANPPINDLPIRVSVYGNFTRRGGAAFRARMGNQELRGVTFEPDGMGFVGYLPQAPNENDSLVLRRGSLELETNVRFPSRAAGASATDDVESESDPSELLYSTAYPWSKSSDTFDLNVQDDLDRLVESCIPLLAKSADLRAELTSFVANHHAEAKTSGRVEILKEGDYRTTFAELRNLTEDDARKVISSSPGITDKKRGRVYLLQWGGSGRSRLDIAIHEAIHLWAYEPGAGIARFRGTWGTNPYEAVTELFARTIVARAGIDASAMSGHSAVFPLAKRLAALLTKKGAWDLLVAAYFCGRVTELENKIEELWPGQKDDFRVRRAQNDFGGALRLLEDAETSSVSHAADVSYSRAGAVAYARKFWNKPCSDGAVATNTGKGYVLAPSDATFEPDDEGGENLVSAKGKTLHTYKSIDDCTHFISCCIGRPPKIGESFTKAGYKVEPAGGLDVPSTQMGHPLYGWVRVSSLVDWLTKKGIAKAISTKKKESEVDIKQLSPGDLIAYWDPKREMYAHFTIYLGDGNIACHTVCRVDKPWQLNGDKLFTFLRMPK